MVSKNASDLVKSRGPKFPPRGVMLTCGSPDAIRLATVTDSTTTIVQVLLYGEIIGAGLARRHPKDERNQDLGMALAMSRALMDAGARYALSVDRLIGEQPDPSASAIKELRTLRKKDSKRRKDIRRKGARRLHRELYGWDHTNRPTIEGFNDALNRRAD